MSKSTRPAIAVVGVSALFPGSLNATGFWRDILEGTDRISDVPASHWLIEDYYDDDKSAQDMTYARRGAFLGNVDFDALGWGVPPSIVPATDTSQLLALIVAQRVLDDAARERKVDRSRISVILGVTSAQELLGTMVSRLQRPVWRKSLRDAGLPEDEVTAICDRISDHYVPWQESSFPGLLGNVVAGRIANRLDLGGTNCVTDAACASTFSAISMGANELYLGDSDMVIVGGVDTMNDIFMYMCFSKTPALSATGDCRPFSDQADGTMLGEGLGMVALKRLDDAERDGDHIYAVLKGVGSSSDGRAKSVYAPRSSGQANALRRAYDHAGYSTDSVELLEAHGTGTKAGDAAEFGGLRMAFDESGRADRQWCALGSVKSQIGHTKAAAGAAGLFKAVMALRHRVLPPTIKVDRPNPALELEKSAFYLGTTARPWVRGADHPRRAGVSSFGFGGSNFHLAMEEYTGPADVAPRLRTASHELVILTGRDGADVVAQAKKHAGQSTTSGYLHWLAHTSQSAYSANAPARLAIVAIDEADLASKLTAAAERITKAPGKAVSTPDGTSYGVGGHGGSVAFLFPGQGSQYVGMTAGAAMAHAHALSAWDDAAALGLHEFVFPKSAFDDETRKAQSAALTRTENAQPAIGISSRALLNLLTRTGLTPAMVGGHSYGEVTALHAAGVLSADDLVGVARRRGELMAEAAKRPGAMTAVSAPIEAVAEKAAKLGVVVANHNHPTQVVLSGPTEAIAAAEKALAADGLRCSRLSVATAFHSPVVSDSVTPFAEFLAGVTVGSPSIPVYANATAAPYPADADAIREQLSNQIRSSVRFVEMVEAMYDAGARTFVEVGPNAVLTGLVGRILKGREHTAVSMDRKGSTNLKAMTIGLARLVAAGADFAPAEALWADYGTPDNPHERVKPKMAIPINGANYNKPYPPKNGAAGLPAPNPPRKPLVVEKIVEKVVEKVVERIVEVPVEVRVEVPVAQAPGAYAPTQPAPTFAAAQPVAPSMAWIEAWQSAQMQTAEAHSAYQRAMADAHSAFLKTAETSFMGLSALAGGFNPAQPMAQQPTFAPPMPAAAPIAAPVVAPAPVAPAPMPIAAPAPVVAAPVIAETPAPAAVPAPKPVAQPVAAKPAAPSRDLHALLLEVVAEKTGYPAEMLNMEMQLEGDLGIDSIKRVEILSAMQEKAPELPEVDAGAMASLQTLGQIADYMAAQLGDTAPAAAPVAAAPSVDLHAILLDVVAEKTGYPAEMLAMEMQLEGDLGIDSIKRVEILSAMQEKAPGLPEVDAGAMASLQTLGQIADYMTAQLGEAAPAPTAAPAAPSRDLHALLLEVVAEKTGYPAEMLNMEMQLEGDLGIDSIKRVEILSAMQEKAPELPEVDAGAMASLQTLGQIADYMGAQLGSIAPAAAAPAAPALDLQAILLDVVAEKTGYPAEMLNMEMQLEGDLGIDSIKRVEILSAMQERAPGLPEVDAGAMASLQTLGQIADYMGAQLNATAPTPTAAPAAPSRDLQALLLEVVAEKTGYPAEMLNMEMQLEGDLGIDSIKRVEILSAMQEKAPELPEVDAGAMASLQTLGQIADYMGAQLGDTAAAAAPAPVVAEAAPTAPAVDLGRYALEAIEAPAAGMTTPGLLDGQRVVITDDGAGVAAALAEALIARGVPARTVDDVPANAEVLIFLGGLRAVSSDADAAAINREGFDAAKAVAARFAESGGVLVTVQDTGGAFGFTPIPAHRAWLSGLAALARTAAQEWPAAQVRTIDLERGERSAAALASALADELLDGGPEREVGLSADGTRRILHDVRLPAPTGALILGASDVVVVSGGARGVTASSVIALAAATGAKFALLGRTPLVDEPAACQGATNDAGLKRALLDAARSAGALPTPAALGRQVRQILANREIRGTIKAIEAAGGAARYISIDVTDTDGLASALSDVRGDWGPITGIIHGAGVINDKLIAEKSGEDFDWVFHTKVGGLTALLSATADDPLKALVMFSSVAARCGNRGQVDYAMANEVLNKVAQAESASRGIAVRSLGWGPWEGGMVSPQLKAHFESLGVTLIPLKEGADMLVDELRADADRVELVLGGAPRAEALISEGGAAEQRMELRVDRASHPYLTAHAIDGTPVVPVVLVVEWFARAAASFKPGLTLTGLSEVKVLSGIRLTNFDTSGDRFQVSCRQLSNGDGATVALELRGIDGRLHYTATARLVVDRIAPDHTAPKLSLEDWGGQPIYDSDVLFHGPDFQVLREVEGLSDDGISAVLDGVTTIGWSGKNWRTDPAAFDGGLQLALLWSQRVLGGACLPTGIGEVLTWTDTPSTGGLRCVLKGRTVSRGKAVSDLAFLDSDGQLIAELNGVVTHLLPGRD